MTPTVESATVVSLFTHNKELAMAVEWSRDGDDWIATFEGRQARLRPIGEGPEGQHNFELMIAGRDLPGRVYGPKEGALKGAQVLAGELLTRLVG